MTGTKKRYMMMLGAKNGRPIQDRKVVEALRRAGASGFEVSGTGMGRVVMRHDLLRAAKKAKAGARLDALLRPDGARTLYGIADGEILKVTDETVVVRFQQAIQRGMDEPLRNFRYVDISEETSPPQEPLAPTLPAASDGFRAAVKRGMRGTHLVEGGKRLSVDELHQCGWVSSVAK